ncbi:hypothetical protein ACA910_001509 [Epithemia clementina (nom. ined.)]
MVYAPKCLRSLLLLCCRIALSVIWLQAFGTTFVFTTAFVIPKATTTKAARPSNAARLDLRSQTKHHYRIDQRRLVFSFSFNNNDNEQDYKVFDLSKPVFDMYTLRGVRGDALAKYNSLNQSEPLRINLSLLAAFSAICYPLLLLTSSTSLPIVQDGSSGGDVAAVPVWNGDGEATTTIVLCLAAAISLAANFVRECKRRNRQLTRLEKELQALELPIRMPAKSVLADSLYDSSVQSIRQIQQSRTLRVLALLGNKETLKQALQQLFVLSRRLVQSETIVLPVPTDDSTLLDWGLDPSILRARGQQPWLAAPGNVAEWKAYFTELSAAPKLTPADDSMKNFKWFGLSALGRSFSSGQGSIPSWIQLMGQHLRPTALLDEDDRPLLVTQSSTESENDNDDTEIIIIKLREFYRALTEGDETAMSQIFPNDGYNDDEGSSLSSSVTDIMQQGGRLDPWQLCLQEGNRPAGMKVADADVIIRGDCAYSTVVEFPAIIGGGVPMAVDASLLAQQNWIKDTKSGEWKLVQHQTIPWSSAARAGGTLVCDKRGCVSLVRGS